MGSCRTTGPAEDFSSEDRQSLVLDLRWFASDNLTLDYRFEQAEIKDAEPFNQLLNDPATSDGIISDLTTFFGGFDPDRLDEITSRRFIPAADQQIDAHTLWVHWDIDDVLQLESITGYRDLDSFSPSDFLPTATVPQGAPVLGRFMTDFEQFSQELQLLGSTEHWEFVAGLTITRTRPFRTISAASLSGRAGW
ncbi:MAG: hypothetical protein U5K56_01475 [Halioglobus sp.]|nr:hypothetical protein [Halioglobus sp.]